MVRFAVGSRDGPQSSVRCFWTNRNDVYLTLRGQLGGVQKLSFHASGICRRAFTKEHGRPVTMRDRVMIKWRRMETPPRGSNLGAGALTLIVPTAYLSTTIARPDKPVRWVEPAPAGGATAIDLFFTMETGERVEELFAHRGERHVLHHATLPRGESVTLAWAHVEYDNPDLRVPASHGGSELLFSATDPHNTGRPVRMELCKDKIADGDRMFLTELGGHAMPPGTEFQPAPSPPAVPG